MENNSKIRVHKQDSWRDNITSIAKETQHQKNNDWTDAQSEDMVGLEETLLERCITGEKTSHEIFTVDSQPYAPSPNFKFIKTDLESLTT